MIYPLKFLPLYKNVIWGGNKLKAFGLVALHVRHAGQDIRIVAGALRQAGGGADEPTGIALTTTKALQ